MENLETDELAGIRAAFEECFQEFEAGDFDTLLIRKFLRRVAEEDTFSTLGDSLYYRWRSLFEYMIRRLPTERSVERELLSLRIQDLWIKQRAEEAREFERKDRQSWSNATIRDVIRSLEFKGVIPEREYTGYEDEDSEQEVNLDEQTTLAMLLKTDIARVIRSFELASQTFNPEIFASSFNLEYDNSMKKMQSKIQLKNPRILRIIEELTVHRK
jgi:hypothetical protein